VLLKRRPFHRRHYANRSIECCTKPDSSAGVGIQNVVWLLRISGARRAFGGLVRFEGKQQLKTASTTHHHSNSPDYPDDASCASLNCG
jgi:hypothetical protein